MPVLEPVTTSTQQTTKSLPGWISTSPKITNLSRMKKRFSNIRTQLKPLIHPARITKYLTNYPLSFPLRPETFALWLLLLLSLLVLTALIASGINQNVRDRLWNYTIPLSPNVYLVLAVLIQSVADVVDFSIRSLHPCYELRGRGGAQTAGVLFSDYAASLSSRGVLSTVPVADAVGAWTRGHHFVCLSVLASLAITVVAVFLGSLQLSSSYYGATSFLSDQTAATGAAWLLGLAVVVYAAVWWKVRRVLLLLGGETGGIKRPVESVMGVAPYVVFSEGLREDLAVVAGLDGGGCDGGKRARELERKGSRYAMGVWTDATGHVLYGVERQYDGQGRVNLRGVI